MQEKEKHIELQAKVKALKEREKKAETENFLKRGWYILWKWSFKNVQTTFKFLLREIEAVKGNLIQAAVSKEHIEAVRQQYSQWLAKYDKLYRAREDYANLLAEPEVSDFREECDSRDTVWIEFKTLVEDYFLQFGKIQRSESCN